MLRQILSVFSWKSLQRMPALPAEFWNKVKTRWRHNPGFVAAAAAGSIGLALALLLGIQGALRLFDQDPSRGPQADEFADAVLNGSADDLGDEIPAALKELRAKKGASIGVTSGAKAGGLIGSGLDGDEFQEDAPPKKLTTSKANPVRKRHPFDMDDDEDNDPPVRIQPRGRHPLAENPISENPLADEVEAPQKIVRLPVDADDEIANDEADDVEPAQVAKLPEGEKSPSTKAKSGPSFGADEPDADDADIADDSTETTAAGVDPAGAAVPGWKNQPSKPLPKADSQATLAQKSRVVETVIYATPEAPASNNARRDDVQDEVAASRLILEIAGPRAARIGQTCNFEIRVKNPERKSAERITLSVELPAELVHEVAQALEQHVERLGPGQTYRALVRTRAKAAGKVSLKVDVTLPGRPAAKSTATIEIAGGSTPANRSDRAARR